jgi:hypothetical protein
MISLPDGVLLPVHEDLHAAAETLTAIGKARGWQLFAVRDLGNGAAAYALRSRAGRLRFMALRYDLIHTRNLAYLRGLFTGSQIYAPEAALDYAYDHMADPWAEPHLYRYWQFIVEEAACQLQ